MAAPRTAESWSLAAIRMSAAVSLAAAYQSCPVVLRNSATAPARIAIETAPTVPATEPLPSELGIEDGPPSATRSMMHAFSHCDALLASTVAGTPSYPAERGLIEIVSGGVPTDISIGLMART